MRRNVAAWRRPRDLDESIQVTEAVFTFVAIDADRRPRPIPPERRSSRVDDNWTFPLGGFTGRIAGDAVR
jgi:acyl-CoA thioesterase YciA